MTNNQSPIINTASKNFDLEDRTYDFAKRCRDFVKRLPKSQANFEYSKQLIRSSGSVAANYIEANDSLGDKDFFHKIKITRKEAKESRLWLKLCEIKNEQVEIVNEQRALIQEAGELNKIFSSILEKNRRG